MDVTRILVVCDSPKFDIDFISKRVSIPFKYLDKMQLVTLWFVMHAEDYLANHLPSSERAKAYGFADAGFTLSRRRQFGYYTCLLAQSIEALGKIFLPSNQGVCETDAENALVSQLLMEKFQVSKSTLEIARLAFDTIVETGKDWISQNRPFNDKVFEFQENTDGQAGVLNI